MVRRECLLKQKKRPSRKADLKHFYMPYEHDDFGLDTPADYGTLIYDEEGHYHERED